MSSSFRPNIFYAQHFLKDPRLVTSLLDRCTIGYDDVVYEIGPGKGMITEQLAQCDDPRRRFPALSFAS
ncbi:MAG: hypothetical protein E6J22_01380 [Chloroflexi bacterium]|nr:MAG: hypothetical protein E6J22_01380 [Chloroflexota bacterium]